MITKDFVVRVPNSSSTTGQIHFGGKDYPCAIGRGGITHEKQEGDGATPIGEFELLHGFYREDRRNKPQTKLPIRPLKLDDGWCDAPLSDKYNQQVPLPFAESHEKMWRKDRLYDYVIVLDYNIKNPKPHVGSAIFFHLAHEKFKPTEGCIAVSPDVMVLALAHFQTGAKMVVKPA